MVAPRPSRTGSSDGPSGPPGPDRNASIPRAGRGASSNSRFAILTLAALLALALLAACSGGGAGGPPPTPIAVTGDGTVTVRASEWKFEPSSIQVEQGHEITIVLQNDGRILHNLKLEGLDGELIQSTSSGPQKAGQGELFVGADSNDSGTLVFRPLQPGTYSYYCTIDAHRALGMEGTLTVVP